MKRARQTKEARTLAAAVNFHCIQHELPWQSDPELSTKQKRAIRDASPSITLSTLARLELICAENLKPSIIYELDQRLRIQLRESLK